MRSSPTPLPPRRGSLTADKVSRAFGPVTVLDDATLTVGPGARIGLVGPNGTGKSTLLRILAGLDHPDRGRVLRSPADLSVGHLAQEPDVRAGETVAGHLARRTGVAPAARVMDDLAARLHDDTDAIEAYSEAVERWTALGGADLEARAAVVCEDVGLGQHLLDRPVAALSGGQAARLGLAAILLSRHDVLLLDEPTNDLDLAGLTQLEAFVASSPAAMVIVSHDRRFLAATVRQVAELDEHSRTVTVYDGGWEAYLAEREQARRHAYEAWETYTAERQRLQEQVRRHEQWERTGAKRVKTSGESDKYIRWYNLKKAEGQGAKANRAEKALDRLDATRRVEKPWEGWELRLDIEPSHRAGAVVARLSGAVAERGSFRLGPVDLEIGWGERVAIVGPNGSGKTTLLAAILGRLPLAEGSRYLGPGVVTGELDQRRTPFAGGDTLIDAFVAATGTVPEEARTLLAKFGLVADHVLRPGASLSPGERTRAQLALLAVRQANVLVLDEPTNHLDLPAIEQLEGVLDRYSGTVLLVTHDRALLDRFHPTRTVDVPSLSRR